MGVASMAAGRWCCGISKLLSAMLFVVQVSSGTTGENINMNGKYYVASGPHQDVDFNDDYASKGHEYFDFYGGEIATHYGEVYWTDQGKLPLPDDIVKRFAGKVIAVTGYEQDQVMVDPVGRPGLNPEHDVSVPINWAYNHHYVFWIVGHHAELRQVEVDPTDVGNHGSPMKWMAFEKESASFRANPSIPTSQWFSEGNGGESRKSFHGYPDGYAQLIDSPNLLQIIPMQIDTRNRDCGVTPADIKRCTKFVPGPEPRSTRFGRGVPKDTNYSGLLECPCNSRFGGDPMFYPDAKTKILEHEFTTLANGTCGVKQGVHGAAQCFAAAPGLGLNVTSFFNSTASDPKLPAGCSVSPGKGGTATVNYNMGGKAACGALQGSRLTGQATSAVNVTLGLELDVSSNIATISISGPADVWFGVGFNATLMADQPYTIIVNAHGVMERKIGTCGSEADHCPGVLLDSSLKLVSNVVENNVRTVAVTRSFKGLTSEHYTFNPAGALTLSFLTAVGQSQEFAYHKAHNVARVSLAAADGPTCICDLSTIGKLCEAGGEHCNSFVKNCIPQPAGDLLAQRNPTCNSRQYIGGLNCCGHRRIMLDADQEVRPELLRYHMKLRIWFQEYKPNTTDGPASHYNLPRIYYQTEANAGEYDVPPAFARPGEPIPGYPAWPLNTPTPGTTCTGTCPDGPDCDCVHTINFRWQVSNMRLIYAGGHCHAPNCLLMELYRNDTGELLCRQIPKFGTGNVEVDKFDEAGYATIPPCLWGYDKGLQPSELLPPNTPLLAVKKVRNTHTGHYGDMASWQMRGVNFPAPERERDPGFHV